MRKTLKAGSLIAAAISIIESVSAHCPLCTAGAGVAAAGAAYLGVEKSVVALFIGAFAISTGWWMANRIERQYIPHQRTAIIASSFLLTVVPILPILQHNVPYYLAISGEYGSVLHRTYVINLSLVTAVIGGLMVCATPTISRTITGWRNGQHIPFQGILLTFVMLLVTGSIIQVL